MGDSVVRTVDLGYVKGKWAAGSFDWGVMNYSTSLYDKNRVVTGGTHYPLESLKLTVNGTGYDSESGAWDGAYIISIGNSSTRAITNGRVAPVAIYLLAVKGAGAFSGSAALLQFELYSSDSSASALKSLIDMQLTINGLGGVENIL